MFVYHSTIAFVFSARKLIISKFNDYNNNYRPKEPIIEILYRAKKRCLSVRL